MNNRLIRKKPNRFLYGRNNYFDIGGTLPLKDAVGALDTIISYAGELQEFPELFEGTYRIGLDDHDVTTNYSKAVGDWFSQDIINFPPQPNLKAKISLPKRPQRPQPSSSPTEGIRTPELTQQHIVKTGNSNLSKDPNLFSNLLQNEQVQKAVGTAVGQIGGGLIGGGLQTGVGNTISGLSGLASAIPGPVGTIASAGLGLVGGLTNRMFGSKMNDSNIAKVEQNINQLNSFQSNASDYDTLTSNYLSAPVGMTFNNSYIGKDGWFSNKAKNKANDLRQQINTGNTWVQNSLANNALNIQNQQMTNLLSNYAAYGGQLYGKGGTIHIKPSKRGTFTAAATKHGMGVQEFASRVLANKDNYSPAMVKKANFARNASKWHDEGGPLISNGGIFDTGINYVGNGGTHEENPYEGVPMGVDEEGTPNLVEEGEVIWNDYVFSNRLKVPKAVRKKYKLGGNKNLTFADAALKLSKESEERPNDPISQRGLDSSMNMLMQEQEVIRQQTDTNKFAKGGKFGKLYAGEIGDPYPQFLQNIPAYRKLQNPILPVSAELVYRGNLPKYPVTITRNQAEQAFAPFDKSQFTGDNQFKYRVELPSIGDAIKNRLNTPLIDDNTATDTNTDTTDKKSNIPTWMRYTPIYANGVLSLTDALGLTNQPNYYEASQLQNAAINAANYTPTRYTPIGNYLTYKPYDINYGINNLNSALGLQRRALLNNIGSNRAQAAAYLLASDNQYLDQIGDLYKSAEEYNQAQRQKVEEFNRATNSANAEGAMKAAMANAEAREKAQALYLSGLEKASEIRQAERAQSTAARSANLSNFIQSIADMGRENFARNMIVDNPANYYSINSDGTIDYKAPFYDLPKEQQDYIVGHATRNSQTKANGGYLTVKRRRK